ncbi:M20 family metallo-hydrolase [Streptomyces sp. NPDC050504]|uniref:M20 family metallo-hydrolase n=1 Tax=Streptomyces sp. NPDC050504 TaxID=3365618 RepID=UPI003789CCCF
MRNATTVVPDQAIVPDQALVPADAPDTPWINGARLLDRIDRFAEIGGDENGGVTRMGFGPADREARSALVQEAVKAGLEAGIDAGGNVLVRRPDQGAGERPRLLIGSHLDTVANGGRLDGTYGVLAGLEVLQTLHETGTETSHEIVVAAFANEEGALFPQPFWGSMVLAGRLDALPEDPRDYTGAPLREALALTGGDLSRLDTAVWAPGSLAGYLEIHVEQGPVLERLGKPIGVVDSITGRTQLKVEVRGAAGHAGTTPMKGRRDPLVTASQIVLTVRQLAEEQRLCRVATVGRLDVSPNSPNTIAQSVQFDVDLRDSTPHGLAAAEETLRGTLAALAHQGGVEVTAEATIRTAPVLTDRRLRAAVTRSAEELGLAHETLPSGAGHDAQVIADIAPVGMIFVPSTGGVSHVPEEHTAPEDLVTGVDVLLRTVLGL